MLKTNIKPNRKWCVPLTTITVDDSDIKQIARYILPAIQEFFESDEGKREFEEWQAEQIKRCDYA